MKILITGGAGFVGSHLAEKLSKNNELVIIDDLTMGKVKNIEKIIKKENVEFMEGSITNLALVKKISKGVDWVFHQAALTSVPRSIEDPIKTNEVNVKETLNGEKSRVRLLIFCLWGYHSIAKKRPWNRIRNHPMPYPSWPEKIIAEFFMKSMAYRRLP